MKTNFKVEQSDLVGDIKDFPIEVVEKMIEEQIKQGNCPNVEVFQKYNRADRKGGGFNWSNTDDGLGFWQDIINNCDFVLFFEKYPKKAKLVYIVGDSEIGMDIIKTLEKYGGINHHGYCGNTDGALYYIEPNNDTIEMCDVDADKNLYEVLLVTYTRIDVEESVLEVTMEEIAEKFGVDVSNLRIKK